LGRAVSGEGRFTLRGDRDVLTQDIIPRTVVTRQRSKRRVERGRRIDRGNRERIQYIMVADALAV